MNKKVTFGVQGLRQQTFAPVVVRGAHGLFDTQNMYNHAESTKTKRKTPVFTLPQTVPAPYQYDFDAGTDRFFDVDVLYRHD